MSLTSSRIILASASPRRRELLQQIGVQFRVLVSNSEETPAPGEAAEDYVRRVALAKARAVWQRLPAHERCPVLGADTEVVLDGAILGKPADRNAGLAMLERLSGCTHEVLSAVALVYGDSELLRVSRSAVSFRPTTPQEREAYWASGEPTDKAGGYAVQGVGAVFINRLDGSYSGVMGLPIFETAELLRECGIDVLSTGSRE
jgi:septum formation protein